MSHQIISILYIHIRTLQFLNQTENRTKNLKNFN